ncbi:peptidoglycan-binding domain-containing protein [Shimia haliotis]|uniref:Putative peptidoglycan binding domain-containing protein n=1 Tax=Shimia haliotis TaxID=1280847 RepID=A0A1I4H9Z3_9RHOB|nr:peptidoglycan-binding domain-containing protein [Shimia haliotis]SFL38493.1 Putative peptidoglycan binding domain-containing protein [Shimia haliotis]
MFRKSTKMALAAAVAVTMGPTTVAASDIGAAIVGGIIGGALVGNAKKSKTRSSSNYSAARAQNRETQTSLNYFGFNAGTPDGVMGQRSRSAIIQYQTYVGFPATGKLSPYERDFLVSSYNRAQVGGPQVVKAMQTHQHGVRSLLTVWYDESTGVRTAGSGYTGMPDIVGQAIDEVAESSDPSGEQLLQRSGFIQLVDLNGDGKNDYILDTSLAGSSFWCNANDCTVMVFTSAPQGYNRSDFLTHNATPASFSCHMNVCRLSEPQMAVVQQPAAPAQPTPTVPVTQTPVQQAPTTTMVSAQEGAQPLGGITVFETATPAPQQSSLASRCSKVALLTSSNGGFVTAANLADAEFAMNEQFCLARTYSIGTGENLVSSLNGVTNTQVDSQCDAFGPALAPYLPKLSSMEAPAVAKEVQRFVLESSMSMEQLSTTAKICLFSGYRRDNMDVALGAALLMVGLGQKPYAELVGHHLAFGYGVGEQPEKAAAWYDMAVSALEGGAEPVFAPGQPERAALLRAAMTLESGGAAEPQPASAALPTFNLGD